MNTDPIRAASSSADGGSDIFEPEELLGFWQRTFLLCAAGFCGVVGIGAMFLTENEAATAALVTGAMLLAVIAILGKVPLRGSLGGFNWDLTRRLLKSDDRRVSSGAAEEVLEAAKTERVPDDVVASARESLQRAALDYEREVLRALAKVATRRQWLLTPGDAHGPDATLTAGDTTLLVEVQAGRMNSERGSRLAKHVDLYYTRMMSAGQVQADGLLLIGEDVTAHSTNALFNDLPEDMPLLVVLWGRDADDDQMEQALLSVLPKVGSEPHRPRPVPRDR